MKDEIRWKKLVILKMMKDASYIEKLRYDISYIHMKSCLKHLQVYLIVSIKATKEKYKTGSKLK